MADGISVGLRPSKEDGKPVVVATVVTGLVIACEAELPWRYAQDLAVALWDQAERVRIMRGEKP